MKRIDRLVLRSFVGPFLFTFFITLFIIVMQFFWLYIDDLIGKGLEWYVILKLVFYASASLVPMALPLAVLLSSIMTFGNLGERYELVAFKSSGISLLRIMRAVMVSVIGISIGALFFSNVILPKANLKLGSLLYDIRHQKPALNIKEGVFYDELEGYSIRIGKKGEDNQTLYDILVYDLTGGRGNDNVLLAEKGEMFTTPDDRFLILRLYNGRQYQEIMPEEGPYKYEHASLYFEQFEKVFDMGQFQLDRTDESFWKDHQQMMNLSQLKYAMDTIQLEMDDRVAGLDRNLKQYFGFKRYDLDSLTAAHPQLDTVAMLNRNLLTLSYSPEEELRFMKRALSISRSVKSFVGIAERDLQYRQKSMRKHLIEWHRKFTLAIACIVLFFVGAPLGAIIRKGGLGMPLLMSIIFFVIFHVFSMSGERVAEEGGLSPFAGMWLATGILLPMGIFLTYKAIHDSALLSLEWYYKIAKKLFRRKE